MYAALTAIDDFMHILSFKISGKAHFYQKQNCTNLQLESTYHIFLKPNTSACPNSTMMVSK